MAFRRFIRQMAFRRMNGKKKGRIVAAILLSALIIYVVITLKHLILGPVLELDLTRLYIERTIEESLKEDKGTGCDVPNLDPFAKEIRQFDKPGAIITCKGKDWVRCYFSKCKVIPEVLKTLEGDVICTYRDILYENDYKYTLGQPTIVSGNKEYLLQRSDHVKVSCKSSRKFLGYRSWVGFATAFRFLKPKDPPKGREHTVNVLIFGFDSSSKNGFIRKMPKSYKYVTQVLNATVLNRYHILGDGTPASLFPILTGKGELELPECRKTIAKSGHVDDMPFIFYKLKEDGYRTAYFEDMPHIGTFQYRFNGFRHQPADHYLRAFYLEEAKSSNAYYCVGDKPRFQLMMNITEQFLKLDGKHYAFTLIGDICHDDFNLISNADEPFVRFLSGLLEQGILRDTLLFIMGDHGPRFADMRSVLQGKLEERLPLMAIRIPETLTSARPDIVQALKSNVETLTTPHDIYATVLDAIDMTQHWNSHKIKGADLTRGMTLFQSIPRNRSCSEAGIQPHWCSCLKWVPVNPEDPMYSKSAQALLDQINEFTDFVRSKCVVRTLTSIESVLKMKLNTRMLQFQTGRDRDGYVGKFGSAMPVTKEVYQVKITVGPGNGVYEATVTYNKSKKKFYSNIRTISRTNPYNTEPKCISEMYPHLDPYCYCKI